ncbi:hypothetical protein MIR68_003191 [Amoeboaphelidium protococcarum]|nr:hypothetical protein MIR68_003191 [Amoeboaphelidium protococcarum]
MFKKKKTNAATNIRKRNAQEDTDDNIEDSQQIQIYKIQPLKRQKGVELQEKSSSALKNINTGDDQITQNTQDNHADNKDNKNTAKKSQMGPQKLSSSAIRITSRFDYQPDVCKDYKETGFCGFGDSCIFLHDRTEYKQGWQIDKEHEQRLREKELNGDKNDDQMKDDTQKKNKGEDIPFKCVICKSDYKKPVITRCGHYFCQTCAFTEFRKSSKCFICGQDTMGIFNVVKKVPFKSQSLSESQESESPSL